MNSCRRVEAVFVTLEVGIPTTYSHQPWHQPCWSLKAQPSYHSIGVCLERRRTSIASWSDKRSVILHACLIGSHTTAKRDLSDDYKLCSLLLLFGYDIKSSFINMTCCLWNEALHSRRRTHRGQRVLLTGDVQFAHFLLTTRWWKWRRNIWHHKVRGFMRQQYECVVRVYHSDSSIRCEITALQVKKIHWFMLL